MIMKMWQYLISQFVILKIFMFLIVFLRFLPELCIKITNEASKNLLKANKNKKILYQNDTGFVKSRIESISSNTNHVIGIEDHVLDFQIAISGNNVTTINKATVSNQLKKKKNIINDDENESETSCQQKVHEVVSNILRGTSNVTQIAKMFEENRNLLINRKPSVIIKNLRDNNFENNKINEKENIKIEKFSSVENLPVELRTKPMIVNGKNNKCETTVNKRFGMNFNSMEPKKTQHNTEFFSTSPVESVEEILAQRRFSRTFSQYSISDLLEDIPSDETAIDRFIESITN